ncbi:alpha/beta fold hydrolase [Streptomyces albidoflavus]
MITFSFRGHGASGGRSTVGDREVIDLAAAVAWARRLGHRTVWTIGFSMGGSVVLRHAALYPAGGPDAHGSAHADAHGPAHRTARPRRRRGRGQRPGPLVRCRGTAMRRLHWVVRPLGRAVGRYGLRTRIHPSRLGPRPLAPAEAASRIAPPSSSSTATATPVPRPPPRPRHRRPPGRPLARTRHGPRRERRRRGPAQPIANWAGRAPDRGGLGVPLGTPACGRVRPQAPDGLGVLKRRTGWVTSSAGRAGCPQAPDGLRLRPDVVEISRGRVGAASGPAEIPRGIGEARRGGAATASPTLSPPS